MTLTLMLALAVLGACTGFCAGLLGIGGGMLLVPFLTFLFTYEGFPAAMVTHMAIATSMATILFTSLSSVRAHHQRGAVLWPVVWRLAPGIFLGALLGGKVFTGLKTGVLALLFVVFISYSAYQMLKNRKPKPSRQLPGTPGMLGAGGVIGFLSSLVGAGGGFVSVPFMSWCNVSMHNAVATSAALGFPIALFTTLNNIWNTHAITGLPSGSLGYIHLPALACIAFASILTAPLGAKVAHQLDVQQLKKVFSYVLFALASYMLYRAIIAF